MAHDTTDDRSPDGIGADEPHSKTQPTDTTPPRPANASPGDESDTLDVDGLAALLHRRRSTILTDRSRNPERVPPSCTPPGARYPLWIRADVLAWLRQHPDPPRHRPHSGDPVRRRHPGRPTKVESLRRARGRA